MDEWTVQPLLPPKVSISRQMQPGVGARAQIWECGQQHCQVTCPPLGVPVLEAQSGCGSWGRSWLDRRWVEKTGTESSRQREQLGPRPERLEDLGSGQGEGSGEDESDGPTSTSPVGGTVYWQVLAEEPEWAEPPASQQVNCIPKVDRWAGKLFHQSLVGARGLLRRCLWAKHLCF